MLSIKKKWIVPTQPSWRQTEQNKSSLFISLKLIEKCLFGKNTQFSQDFYHLPLLARLVWKTRNDVLPPLGCRWSRNGNTEKAVLTESVESVLLKYHTSWKVFKLCLNEMLKICRRAFRVKMLWKTIRIYQSTGIITEPKWKKYHPSTDILICLHAWAIEVWGPKTAARI